jgi:TfoX/Sxy family transcriptional regulator of competence genes
VAYDEALLERCLDRLRELRVSALRHKNVFGMRGLLRGARMFAAVGESSIVVRLLPGDYARAVKKKGVRPFMPGGSRLGTWVEVEDRLVADDPELRDWLAAGLRSLG